MFCFGQGVPGLGVEAEYEGLIVVTTIIAINQATIFMPVDFTLHEGGVGVAYSKSS